MQVKEKPTLIEMLEVKWSPISPSPTQKEKKKIGWGLDNGGVSGTGSAGGGGIFNIYLDLHTIYIFLV